ncbi:hypothetical protein DFP72DRAFT_1062508 [Ephemerocybe angulata]|uniref:Fungal-type protein kinase domain-containing protein n=1 Tax=Ephemerocybe angulata TaxID=980116 RepID=A0A8H6IAU5_9AGAR|nr:hypothetical protein DFP72DRAFT_1062508 [Tulosesus angulatus]
MLNSVKEGSKLREMWPLITEELRDDIYVVNRTFISGLFQDVATDKAISEFLSDPASGYTKKRGRSGRWTSLPKGESEGISEQHVRNIVCVASASQAQSVQQLGTYCRQIFIKQPNRNFVRTLVITEKRVRLIHFDCSGVYMSDFIDFHENPALFVRLVLRLTSPDEELLGFDTSVKWTVDEESGNTTVNSDGQEITYNLNMDEEIFVRASIRGRGTVCWPATHPVSGRSVLIKDSWRTATRESESKYLEAVKGIEGVAQMISYHDFCADTENYRPSDCEHDGFHNRTKLRVVLEYYGKNVWNFKSRFELVAAFRDALHTARSSSNTSSTETSPYRIYYLGRKGQERSSRNFNHLDMAIWADRTTEEICQDPRSGDYLYQSVAILLSMGEENQSALAQDYLDDIESFFYALVRIIFFFKKLGKSNVDRAPFLVEWGTCDAGASNSKDTFIRNPISWTHYRKEFWGESCKKLIT